MADPYNGNGPAALPRTAPVVHRGYARRVEVGVLIAGAGPVGLSLACELERHGVEHRIVDSAPARAAVSRATDLHARSLELWDHTGVADEVLAAALPITDVPLFSGGREVARLDFGGIDSPFPAAVSLRQRELEELLREHLAGGVERVTPVQLVCQDEDGVVVRVGSDEVRAGFLVACDGVHSGLREALGIPFEGGDYPGRWAVMDADIEGWPYGPGELPVFLDHEGFWAMPLPDARMRLFFRDDAAGEQPEMADAQGVIDRHVPGAPRIRGAENRACFTVHHRVARRFRAGRVLLAGDAAHAMTPVNGQGMNTGVQNAYNLAWKLRLALEGAPAAVLDSYEAERRPVALATVRASGELHDANVRSTVLVIADRPPAAPPGEEALADPELRAHGRLGAVADAAYVVRPDGHLGFRCEPPDAARVAEHLSRIGVGA
jgi:2-polyprenyl-6-methoxyphenol hydroxylase-like FAD-dependent oxidoreductase